MSPRSHAITAIDGSALAPESILMLDYLKTRSMELSASAIRERIRAAANEVESAVAGVSASQARLRPIAAKWTIAEVVDHIAQTQSPRNGASSSAGGAEAAASSGV